ncbi:secondary thiamine-phosphate synthase enzyme YjbQ [Microcella humidisoli]|uniref:Secondary thiamine-phosphate synthase enzyme YjbQ n=1 Tax=Microcella humidisoli TaxID=2963406 RepID=A0ABY5FZD5_9MICO|nr:secondary thiamine-phosphate synthase enzyme YjbQ [Microcella humidisoli]UTT63683.1 secondary thiamine-phosphate synthase enzyme YjbQ [Microcella humidisoli]
MNSKRRALVSTTSSRSAVDVTDLISELLEGQSGPVHVSVPHTTCALILSEVDDELLSDYERLSSELLAPFEPFSHIRNDVPNASAHILSAMFGTAIVVFAESGVIDLGRYQRIVLLELDGPKDRTITILPLTAQESSGAH